MAASSPGEKNTRLKSLESFGQAGFLFAICEGTCYNTICINLCNAEGVTASWISLPVVLCLRRPFMLCADINGAGWATARLTGPLPAFQEVAEHERTA